jgi:hypothetical protein
MTIQWVSLATFCVATVVHHTDDSATIAPTERSMPPPVITNVMPMLTTPRTAERRRIVSMLLVSTNRSPAVAAPTMHSSTRATSRPRLRPMLVDSSWRARLPGRCSVCNAACSTWELAARSAASASFVSWVGVSLMPLFLP